jgi:hypothetical protein
MEMKLNMNAVNQVLKDTVVYEENQLVKSISLVLKGRVTVEKNGIKTMIGSGNFLGICDLYTGKYGVTYTAFDNLVLYVFPIEHMDNLENILNSNKEYGGLMVASLSRYMKEIENIHTSLLKGVTSLCDFLEKYYKIYKEVCTQSGFTLNDIPLLDELEPFNMESNVDERKLEYYRECAGIPLDVQKAFYGYGNTVCIYHVEEQAEIITSLMKECTEISCYLFEWSNGLINDTDTCLFNEIVNLAANFESTGKNNNKIIQLLDHVIDKINEIETLYEEKTGNQLPIDRSRMEKMYCALLSGNVSNIAAESENTETEIDDEKILNLMKNSMLQILSFSKLSKEKCELIQEYVQKFVEMHDKLSTEDYARKLRRQINDVFYELYEAVFFEAYHNKSSNPIIELFLKYGYLDDRLLSNEQKIALYKLEDRNDEKGPCSVYNIKEWLTLIFEGKRDPSKSEFDMDYYENIRDMKRSNQITPQEEKEYLADSYRKFQYELQNMFKYNNRIVCGQISTFVPILHKDAFIGNIDKIYLTANGINAEIRKLLMIDYSVFTREILYSNLEKNIKKEYIIQEVFPDIILMPTRGTTGVMWQDITGRKRNTSGRFLLPIFLDSDLSDVLIKLFGRFRWEFCRTLQGAAWNDIKYKSLTSEYADYIQFYRKNRDLSEDKKEKLKSQIQRCRGNTREVFAMDYEVWIKHEAQGAIRLNKAVRELMATYCPYARNLREKLAAQPMFEEAMARFVRERKIKNRDLELRFHALEKEKADITDELMETKRFYNEL